MRHETLDTDTAIAIPAPMTRREKLLRWAMLIRTCKYPQLRLFHLLEKYSDEEMRMVVAPGCDFAFSLALGDAVLLDAGLPSASTLQQHKEFFELTQQELHAFSCDCGGAISNETMAQRIEAIANGG